MQHLDEGTLQALLDGELNATDASQAEKHLALCAACRRTYVEAKGIFSESDRLVGLLEPGLGAGAVPTAEDPPAGDAIPREVRRRRYRQLAWAASLVLAAGLGYLASIRHYAGRRGGSDLAARAAASSAAPGAPASDSPAVPMQTAAEHAAAPPAAPLSGAQPKPASAVNSMKSATPPAPANAARRESPPSEKRDQAAAPTAAASGVALAESRAREQAAPGSGDAITGERAMGLSTGRPAAGNVAEPSRTLARGFRRISMEEAVRRLSGSIHLIDGMAPQWVEAGPGRFVAGAFPDAELIRVVYQDAPGREIWLDQQRLPHPVSLPPGDTVISTTSSGGLRITWQPEPAFRVSICARVPADSLRVLARHVH